jgi:uncharacterized membrane protein YeaQ/YmgE (transglycosylase-associated protein family)
MSSLSVLLMWAATGVAIGWFASMVIRSRGREGAFFDALVGALGGVTGGFSAQHLLAHRLGEQAVTISLIAAALGAAVFVGLWRLMLVPPVVR